MRSSGDSSEYSLDTNTKLLTARRRSDLAQYLTNLVLVEDAGLVHHEAELLRLGDVGYRNLGVKVQLELSENAEIRSRGDDE